MYFAMFTHVQSISACAHGGCGHVGAYVRLQCQHGRPANISSGQLDLLKEAFLEIFTNHIARKCCKKPSKHQTLWYKPEMQTLEPGQPRTDRHTG